MIQTSAEKKLEKQKAIQNKIFDTATDLINNIGYDNVTIRMICESAGISIGMFYRNFKGKSDVLSYFYEKAVEAYEATVLETLKEYPLEEKLIRFYTWLTGFTAGLGSEFVQYFYTPGCNAIKSDSTNNEIVLVGVELIQQAVKEQQLILSPGRTPWKITHDFLIIVKGVLLDWYVSGNDYDAETYAEELIRRFSKNILE